MACMTPRSRGTVTLKPDGTPAIDHGYLREAHDLDVLADGVEILREFAAKMPMIGAELGDRPTGEDLRARSGAASCTTTTRSARARWVRWLTTTAP